MNTKVILGAVLVLFVAVLGFAYFTLPKSATSPATADTGSQITSTASSSDTSSGSTGTGSTQKTYTMANVQTHHSASSCWTAINGKVYDVTSWISQHPGGPEHILPLCGTDGSSAFNGQHAGEGQPAQELASFYIGDLAQ